MPQISLQEKIKGYEKIYTGAITDILDEMGYHNCALPHDLKPLIPGQQITEGQVIISKANDDIAVRPGDFIVGDRDGVPVIHAENSDELLLKAEEVVNTENLIRRDILQGVHPLDAFHKHGRF